MADPPSRSLLAQLRIAFASWRPSSPTPWKRRLFWLLPVALILGVIVAQQRFYLRRRIARARRLPPAPPLHHTNTAPAVTFHKLRRIKSAASMGTGRGQTAARSEQHRRARMIRILSQSKFVSCLGEDRLDELGSMLVPIKLKADEILFAPLPEGNEAGVWIVSRGKIGIFLPTASCPLPSHSESHTHLASLSRSLSEVLNVGSAMCEIGVSESIGEWSLIASLTDTGRCHFELTAAAMENSEVYFLSRQNFEAFTSRHPRALLEFVRTAVARQWRIASFVLDSVLDLPPRSREEVQGSTDVAKVEFPTNITHHTTGMKLVALEPYEPLFYAGDAAHCLYVVESGALVAVNQSEDEEVVARIERGCVCGGISFFGLTPRGETICASESGAQCWEYSADMIDRLLIDDPKFLLPIVRAVARQLAPVLAQFFHLGLDSRWHQAGSIIFEAGDPSTAVFLVISGRVHAVVANTGSGAIDQTMAEYVLGSHEDSAASTDSIPPVDDSLSLKTLFEVSRGELIGEDCSLAEEAMDDSLSTRRPYTAVCVRDSEIVRLSQASFLHLFSINPRSMLRFSRQLSQRLHQLASKSLTSQSGMVAREPPQLAIIACVWIGSSPWSGTHALLSRFVTRLAAELEAFGRVTQIDSAAICRAVGATSPDDFDDLLHRSRASRYLSELEEENRFILLITDPMAGSENDRRRSQPAAASQFPLLNEWDPAPQRATSAASSLSAWSRMAVEQADCVLLVCDAESESKAVSDAETELLWSSKNVSTPVATDASDDDNDEDRVDVRLTRPKDLIILHSNANPAQLPTDTNDWFDGRPIRSHHHIRRSVPEDFARLSRFVAGESIGVVLGGGGARGLAHLGVLRALEEERIPVDAIGGCSQGAFVAALYAQHLDSEAVKPHLKIFAGSFTTWRMVRELTLPILSYFTGKQFSALVRGELGESVQIADVWINFYCVSTNVRRGDYQIHRTGLMWRYVRASMTLLGLLPPVIDDNGDLLLDGGYASNLPVEAMCQSPTHAKTIIAVDVEDKNASGFDGLTHLAKRSDLGMSISGWWLLWIKLVGSVRVPDFRTILVWLACLNHARTLRQAAKDGLIDLYIRPPIDQYQLLDYWRSDEIIQLGYDAAKKAIREWKATRTQAKHDAVRGVTGHRAEERADQAAEIKAKRDIAQTLRREHGDADADAGSESENSDSAGNLSAADSVGSGLTISRAVSEPFIFDPNAAPALLASPPSLSLVVSNSQPTFAALSSGASTPTASRPPRTRSGSERPMFSRNRSMAALRSMPSARSLVSPKHQQSAARRLQEWEREVHDTPHSQTKRVTIADATS